MVDGTGLAVHPYSKYVDNEEFMELGERVSDEMPVYCLEASNYSGELVGDFYEDSFSDVSGGRNGSMSSEVLEDLEEPFYIFGGLVSECIPGAVYSVLSSGYDVFVVEDISFDKLEEDFVTLEDMEGSDEDFSDLLANLYRLGAPKVGSEELLEK